MEKRQNITKKKPLRERNARWGDTGNSRDTMLTSSRLTTAHIAVERETQACDVLLEKWEGEVKKGAKEVTEPIRSGKGTIRQKSLLL